MFSLKKEKEINFDFSKVVTTVKHKNLLKKFISITFGSILLLSSVYEFNFVYKFTHESQQNVIKISENISSNYALLQKSLDTKNTQEKINYIEKIKQLGQQKEANFGQNLTFFSNLMLVGFYKTYLTYTIYNTPEKYDEKLIQYMMNDKDLSKSLNKGWDLSFDCPQFSLLCHSLITVANYKSSTNLNKKYLEYNFELAYIKEHFNDYKNYYQFVQKKYQEIDNLKLKNLTQEEMSKASNDIYTTIRSEDPFIKFSGKEI